MSLFSALSFKALASGCSAAAVIGGGGAVAYIYQDNIVDFVNKSVLVHQPKYEYVVATVSTEVQTTENLYDSDSKQFTCSITIDGTTTSDSDCEIYKLNKDNNIDTIAFQDLADTTKITTNSDLTKDKQVLLKLSKSFKSKLSTTNNTFQLISNKAQSIKITDLKWEFDLNRNQSNSKTPITESSVMVIKLTAVDGFSHANAQDNSYTCEIGSSAGINCKVYKPSALTTANTHESLKTLTSIDTTAPTVGNYLVVDLLGVNKSFADLDNQEIVIKNGTNVVGKGVLDNLLIGTVSTTPNSSVLFKLSDKEIRHIASVDANKNHIVTKFVSKHKASTETFEASSFICRLVEGSTIYQDETCSIYKYWTATDNTFDLATLAGDTKKISAESDITTGKHQIVKLSQTIIDNLQSSNKALEIIHKSKKDKSFNNQYVSLENKGLLSSGSSTQPTLHTNLFVARVKSQETATSSLSTATTYAFKCAIDGVDLNCKIYKLPSDVIGNAIAAGKLSSIEDSITPSTDLATNKYVVVELTNSQKTHYQLKNQVIALKTTGGVARATLEFDQQLFGYVDSTTKVALPLASKSVNFMVAKGSEPEQSTWVAENIGATARCKLAAPDKHENFDYACKLMKFTTPSDNKTVSSLSELTGLTATSQGNFNFKDDTDGFYKLVFDVNKLYNLDLTTFADLPITIELAPTANGDDGKIYGVVQLKQLIKDATTMVGKTDLLLGKVSEAVTAFTVDGAKCKFTEEASEEGFGCTVYKNTATGSTSEKDKVAFNTVVTGSAAFDQNDYYAIKLDEPKDLTELTGKTLIYFEKEPATGSTDTAKKAKFSIEQIMGGQFNHQPKTIFLNSRQNSKSIDFYRAYKAYNTT